MQAYITVRNNFTCVRGAQSCLSSARLYMSRIGNSVLCQNG